MVMERFKAFGCTSAEAGGWLTTQVRDGKLKLSWTNASPEQATSLFLSGEGFIYFPCFPDAQAIDELDWRAGVLRRRVRYPKIADRWGGRDPSTMTWAEQLARDKELRERRELNVPRARHFGQCAGNTGDEFDEWGTEELRYSFRVKRSSLVRVLDRASVPLGAVPVRLSEAAAILASRFNVSARIGRDGIVEAAAAGRIEIYGTSPSKLPAMPGPVDAIRSWIWRQVLSGEATLSDDGSALSAKALNNEPATWSDLHVFRAALERLMRELACEGAVAAIETGPPAAPPAAAQCPAEPEADDPVKGDPSNPLALRGDKRKVWEAAQRHGRPDFSKRGNLAAYVRAIARATGVNEATVRNYVTKATELRPHIEKLPEAPPSKMG